MASTTCPSSRMSGRSGCSACARPRVRRAPGPGSVSGSDGCPPGIGLAAVRQLVRVQPNRSSASRGRPARMPRQRTAAFRTRGLRESASTAAVALSPSKKKTTSRSLTKTWCLSSPKRSTSKGGPSSTSRRAAWAVPRRIGTTTAPLARVPLEDERLVAVYPFTDSAPDLDRRQLVERDPEAIGSTRPVQDEVVVAEFEPAAGGRAVTGAPDDGVLVRTLVNALGGPALLLS